MPFKSKAQRRKFAQLLVEGKISDQTFEEWNRETGRKKLPERIGRTSVKKKAKKRTKRKTQQRHSVSGEAVHVQSVVPAVSTNANALVQCRVVGWIPAEIGG
jgi:hypothetical protein